MEGGGNIIIVAQATTSAVRIRSWEREHKNIVSLLVKM